MTSFKTSEELGLLKKQEGSISFGTVLKTTLVGAALLLGGGFAALSVRTGGVQEAQVAVKGFFANDWTQGDLLTMAEAPHLTSFFREWNDYMPNAFAIDVVKPCSDCSEMHDTDVLRTALDANSSDEVLLDLLKMPMRETASGVWVVNPERKQYSTDDMMAFFQHTLSKSRYDLFEKAFKLGLLRPCFTPEHHQGILMHAADLGRNPMRGRASVLIYFNSYPSREGR